MCMYTLTERDNLERLLAFLKERELPASCLSLNYLTKSDFFRAPASTKYHGAYEGGLFDHSMNVAKNLCKYTDAGLIAWQRPESPVVVGILHDLVKVDLYRHYVDKATGEDFFFHNPNYKPMGHGEVSMMLAKEHVPDITEEELLCIRYHMGAYNREDWDGFDAAIKQFPSVLWTHTADMEASKIQGT